MIYFSLSLSLPEEGGLLASHAAAVYLSFQCWYAYLRSGGASRPQLMCNKNNSHIKLGSTTV